MVDNASSDGSGDWLTANYPDINLICSPKNRGIAGGNNLGIQAGCSRFVLLLNNDTKVQPGTIDRVVAFLDHHPEAAGVGGQLLNPDGSFQSGGVDFPSLSQLFLITTKFGGLIRPYYPSQPPNNAISEVDFMSTAFMLFSREALNDVGLVDEDYFIYADETDLQYRLKEKGWKIFNIPDVKTIHFGGKSLDPWKRRKMVYRGYLLFFQKHYSGWQTWILRLLFAIISGLKIPIWATLYLIPGTHQLAKNEIRSNLDIIAMCSKPGITPPN